ncbi:uncharacterized protein LOC100120295 isoform X1 [Nasonia vitripennis]|uniref:SUN domain-containing protein n=1 Tax=Nasonia vitripennis TaxID=7425 RepID=A0A7M7QXE9_NASVI|nr:uncharacterized protein LOC100120295 isoform X1 [Nasonia vitripennis]XP_031785089.1 uncharacterized protein LOC100120295 isoform X1 [Nasonia vitripennis]XP_031785090.1 uncharacterized protein LOC100120295 isoform X1 [Nasonia vitripennis]XP_031785091.1 uncharacterized protein LOC100120295 isoform X1 [Nasonia vitripennis]XP_032455034.1 uncharacterized protein LOC100120295 isoform X1 [Nasonia vitripennis]XP_032455035.1 uncharacterized protein LOC100120295 isoform X1 [Nasonia vitripennis]XP_03
MESSEQKHYELRSRSRSRSETPQILSRTVTENEGSEHHYELRSRDRSMTPGEVTSSRRSASRSLPSSVVKARNKNMDTITEKDDTLTDNNSDTQSKSSDKSVTITKSTKKLERRSERQRIKRQIIENGESECKSEVDDSDAKSETKERKRESITPKRQMTSDYSSEEGDREDVPSRPGSAYEFYKQQGEYWNKFPKTDYTYSQTSTCRYEVAPGVMAIPNMSRRSLHSDNSFFSSQGSNSQSLSQSSKESFNEENNTMDVSEIRRDLSDGVPQLLPHIRGSGTAVGQSVIYKRTHVEQYNSTRRDYVYDSTSDNQINEKYESWANPLLKSNAVARYRSAANVDSDTELDEAVAVKNYKYRLKDTQSFYKFTSLISTWFFATLHLVTFGQFKKKEFSTSHYYRRYEDTKWSRLRLRIDKVMQHMYLLLVKVVLLDSWLLSKASNIRERAQGRRTKILWLVLLPLFLTIGGWFLPQIWSVISLSSKHSLPEIKEQVPTAQTYVHNEDSEANKELRDMVNLLIGRVQHLEAARVEHSEHLSNVTQILEELKRVDSSIWKHYDEKLVNLGQELQTQAGNRETLKNEVLESMRIELKTLKNLYTQLKSCCDMAEANIVTDKEIEDKTNKVFSRYFGDGFSKQDIVRIFQIMNSKIQQDEAQKQTSSASSPSPEPGGDSNAMGIAEIRQIVLGILKIYDADKTGRVDYALESAGGQIISTRCTQRYNIYTRAFKVLGLTLYYESNNPRTVIQGTNTLQPGMCWAFQDFPGYLLIKLRTMIYVTGFTVEHAPRSILPNGEMKSAPKKFNVWGLRAENDLEPVMFGEYEFLDNNESLQYFSVQNTSITTPYGYVEMRIHSNHGQLEYTCLYRFRVHGNLA